MAYDKELPGCFGGQDLLFAVHPLDKGRAFEWLTSLRARQIGLMAALDQVSEFLTEQRAGAAHVEEQLAAVERHLKPWLGD